jgi:hypothetical protein
MSVARLCRVKPDFFRFVILLETRAQRVVDGRMDAHSVAEGSPWAMRPSFRLAFREGMNRYLRRPSLPSLVSVLLPR